MVLIPTIIIQVQAIVAYSLGYWASFLTGLPASHTNVLQCKLSVHMAYIFQRPSLYSHCTTIASLKNS